jgi:ATP/maltotriose-dependent transcriptional regulator MalT
MFGLGICDLSGGVYDQALRYLQKAERELESTGEKAFLGSTRFRIAQTLSLLGDDEQSSLVLANNLKTLGEKDFWNRGMTHTQLGALAWRHESLSDAEEHFQAALTLQTALGHLFGAATSIDGLARVRVSRGEPTSGAQLLGAAGRLYSRLGTHPFPDLVADRERAVEGAIEILGPERYEVLYAAGERMTHDQLHAMIDDLAPTRRRVGGQDLLTNREMEIAALVARGATNRQISFELVIGLETVKSHIRNILRKLEAESRVQIGAWYGHLH